jgi:hypothetical protein
MHCIHGKILTNISAINNFMVFVILLNNVLILLKYFFILLNLLTKFFDVVEELPIWKI